MYLAGKKKSRKKINSEIDNIYSTITTSIPEYEKKQNTLNDMM